MDEVARRIASLGLPGVMLAVALSIAGGMGLAGAAAITTALAMLGGPLGMMGGIGVLLAATAIGEAVSRYGIQAVLVATYLERRRQGEPCHRLCQEISTLWISEELRREISRQIRLSGCCNDCPNLR
ncbi:hypothetical protein [Floridanema evergladense]|uniref:Uncharacterized protein n=1 Tax=Floridaenema evergladense BLCC-F167 TaxID=3153639 RepID=A0ABV4WQD7_9CYAN